MNCRQNSRKDLEVAWMQYANNYNSNRYGYCCAEQGAGVQGPMGPTGPAGAAVSSAYNPADAPQYTQGQMVMYNGALYVVNRSNPAGTPGSSADYMAVGGGGSSALYDPTKSANYTQGQLVVSNGTVYIVGKNNPSGTPGSSADYTAIAGPAGPVATVNYDANKAPNYLPGQIVVSNGVPYIVQTANPTGTPGSSPSYAPLASGSAPGAAGPTGPMGPQGPQAP
ncbi:MAG: hypothetical protein LBS21_08960 [Clostridiales bacterium]|jgi:hypothetical protein|nr:hypothetical protein [Clostridiales bacterium]